MCVTRYTQRQSPVKNQPLNHKVDNFHDLTKVLHNTRETKVLCDNYYDQANELKLRQ